MKRHPALAHLSRDHHSALIMAQLLKENAPPYRGLPTDTGGKIRYAVKFYQEEVITHFDQEEKMMDLLAGISAEMDEKIKHIKADHILLHQLFAGLPKQVDAAPAMNTLGIQLERHIRQEERELFPLIEKTCDAQMMNALEKILSS